MQLWPFQLEANRALWRVYSQGAKSALLQAPCGSGKTAMAAHFIAMRREHKREKAIVFAHRREIVGQTALKLEGAGLIPEIIMAGHAPNPWSNVKVASVDTVWAAHKRGVPFPEAQFVVVDECHTGILAERYQAMLKHYREQGAMLLGMSATPIGKGGVGLGGVFDEMVRTPDTPWMIEHGYLCQPDYRVGKAPTVNELKLKNYTDKQIEEIMDDRMLIGDVVENWLLYAKDRKTIVFAAGVGHSMHLVAQFVAAGVRAVHIDGDTPKEIRDDVYAKSESGEIQVISNAQVYVEGTDFPWIDCVVDAAITNSLRVYLQKNWRAGRAYPGKQDFLVLDHANNVKRHGRLELPRNWELTEGKEQAEKMQQERKETERVQIQCKVCGFIVRGIQCHHCGTPVRSMQEKGVDFLPGILVEMTIDEFEKKTEPKKEKPKAREYTMSEKQDWYSGFLHMALERGRNQGWAAHRYKEKFGVWPNQLKKVAAIPTLEVEQYDRHLRIKFAKRRESVGATGD
jgi:superfamily II DNA or RNA helicase